MGWVGLGEFVIIMTQNPTWSTIKNIFITQSNPPIPKNQPNLTSWVGSGRFWRVGELATHPYSRQPKAEYWSYGLHNPKGCTSASQCMGSMQGPTYIGQAKLVHAREVLGDRNWY